MHERIGFYNMMQLPQSMNSSFYFTDKYLNTSLPKNKMHRYCYVLSKKVFLLKTQKTHLPTIDQNLILHKTSSNVQTLTLEIFLI